MHLRYHFCVIQFVQSSIGCVRVYLVVRIVRLCSDSKQYTIQAQSVWCAHVVCFCVLRHTIENLNEFTVFSVIGGNAGRNHDHCYSTTYPQWPFILHSCLFSTDNDVLCMRSLDQLTWCFAELTSIRCVATTTPSHIHEKLTFESNMNDA